MSRQEFFRRLDDLMELDPGTIKGGEKLVELGRWESITVLGFMAMMDERYGIDVSPSRLMECQTVDDLYALAPLKNAA